MRRRAKKTHKVEVRVLHKGSGVLEGVVRHADVMDP